MLEGGIWSLLEVYSRDSSAFAAPHKKETFDFTRRVDQKFGAELTAAFELNSHPQGERVPFSKVEKLLEGGLLSGLGDVIEETRNLTA